MSQKLVQNNSKWRTKQSTRRCKEGGSVPPPKWSAPSKWSPPPKWPPITTQMIPTTEMIPAVTTEMIPGISGMELRGLQKLDNNLVRTFYLFMLHLFYGVQFTFYSTLFCSKLFFFWFNTSSRAPDTRQYLFKRCNSLMYSISSNFFLYFCKKIFLIELC